MEQMNLSLEDYYDLEMCKFMIEYLENKRSKIIQRGLLSPYEDVLLDDIDTELNQWSKNMDKIYDRSYDY